MAKNHLGLRGSVPVGRIENANRNKDSAVLPRRALLHLWTLYMAGVSDCNPYWQIICSEWHTICELYTRSSLEHGSCNFRRSGNWCTLMNKINQYIDSKILKTMVIMMMAAADVMQVPRNWKQIWPKDLKHYAFSPTPSEYGLNTTLLFSRFTKYGFLMKRLKTHHGDPETSQRILSLPFFAPPNKSKRKYPRPKYQRHGCATGSNLRVPKVHGRSGPKRPEWHPNPKGGELITQLCCLKWGEFS